MKKIFLIILLFFSTGIGGISSYSSFTVNNLQVKKSSDPDFSNSINVSSNGTQVTFSVNIIAKTTTEQREGKVFLYLPAGFTYNSYTIESDTCSDINGATAGNMAIDSYSDSSFVFRFKPNGTACENIVNIVYTTSTLATGTHNINYTLTDSVDNIFSNGNDIITASNSVSVINSTKISLIKAYTFDLNENGFIDRYDFTFDRNIVGAPTTLISQNGTSVVSGTFSSLGNNTGSIAFTDSIFTTSETPQIKITGDANYEDATYFVGVVEDRAKPKITVNPAGGAFTSSQSVTITSNESGIIRYNIGAPATLSSSLYSGAFSVNSNTGVYYYTIDLVGNVSTGSVSFTFSCSPSTILNGTIGAYPTCAVTCNSGYTYSGGSCVAVVSSGGGGGGGSYTPADYCPLGDLSGNIYDGKCEAPTTSSGTTTGTGVSGVGGDISYVDSSGLSMNSLDVFYFSGVTEAIEYLHKNISNTTVLKLANSYGEKLKFTDSSYYTSFDYNLKYDYNKIINSYVLFFLKINSYIKTKADQDKLDAKALYISISNYLNSRISTEERYIEKSMYENLFIYRTKFEPLKKALLAIETKILAKFKKLKDSFTISEDEYNSGINAYNDFVLNLTIYRLYNKPAEAKIRAINAINIWYKIYKKQIIENPVVEIKETVPVLVKDKYTFSKDLKFGDYNDDVRNLQTILKMYGYFDGINPTGYFGTITKTYLIQFAGDILKIKTTTGIFDSSMRNAIGNLPLK